MIGNYHTIWCYCYICNETHIKNDQWYKILLSRHTTFKTKVNLVICMGWTVFLVTRFVKQTHNWEIFYNLYMLVVGTYHIIWCYCYICYDTHMEWWNWPSDIKSFFLVTNVLLFSFEMKIFQLKQYFIVFTHDFHLS